MREPSIVRITWLRRSGLRALALAALLAGAPLAHANVIFVAAGAVGTGGSSCSLVDAINAANHNAATGACPAGDDKTNGGDVIVLAAGTYKIGSIDNDWYGPNGLPPISSKITIVGDPKGSIIMRSPAQGVQSFRIFFVSGGQSLAGYNPPTDFSALPARGTLTLVNLTLENGLAQGGDGGASLQGSGGGGLGAGGAIYNQGVLTLQGVTLLGNQALGGNAGGSSTSNNGDAGGGGGMAGAGDAFGDGGGFGPNGSWPQNTTPAGDFGNGGSASQVGGVGGGGGSGARGGYGGGGGGGSTLTATGGFGGGFGSIFRGGGAGMGGAIFNEGGTLTLVNCTLTSNNAGGGTGVLPGSSQGGAIFNLNGIVSISFSTLANNTLAGTAGDGGALYSTQVASPGSPAADARSTANVTVNSSILYGTELNTTDSSGNVTSSAATDCVNSGGSFSGSPNVIGATSASCFQSGDSSATPLLFPLANNGGPTQTMAIIFPPAVNGGNPSGAPALDQRGYLRDAAPDMGAYESSNVAKAQPAFAGLQSLTLIAGNNASLAWFNLSGNDATQPVLSLSVLSGNTTVLPAANLALSSNCGGSLALDTCNLSLTPTATKTGTSTVALIASNGYGQTGYGSFTVTVIPPIPVAKKASVSVASGQTLNGTFTATDALSVTFSYTILTQPAHGTLKLTSPGSSAYTYTPAAGYLGADSFTWKANDGSSDSNVATVSITVTQPPPVPGAPSVSNMTLSTPENTTLTGTLQATGASLSFAIAAKPSHGSVKITNAGTGAFSYTPTTGYIGADSFSFTAEDTLLKATSNPATVNITVGPGGSSSGGSSSGGSSSGGSSSGGSSSGGSSSGGSGSGANSVAPLASAMTLSTYTGVPLSGVLTASDAAGNALSFSVTTPAHGTVKLTDATTGAFTYTPAAGYSGSDSFSFTATDQVTGLSSASAGVNLTIASVPVSSQAVPLASNASFNTYVNTAVSGSLSASDAAGNPLNYVLATAPSHGIVLITAATGAFTYTPTTGYTGSDSFSFTATDSVTSVASAVASVALTMNALPSPSATTTAPVASDASLTTYEGVAINASLSASDALGNAVTYTVDSGPSHGTLSGFSSSTGAYTYTPTAGYIGNDSFSFHATDSVNSVASNSATVSISVGALPPPAPVAANLSVSTYQGVPVNAVLPASDGAGDALTFAIGTAPANGATSGLNTATGAFTYTPTAGFFGSDSLTFTASASNGTSAPATVSFSVISTPAGNPPPLASNAALTVYENTAISSQQLSGAPSVAGHVLSYSIVSPPSHGSLTGFSAASGTYGYTPNSNYSGPDAFTFTVTDTTASPNTVSSPAAVVITVAAPPTGTPPQASSASFKLFTGQALDGTLVAVDTSGDALSYSAVQPGHGTVSVTASSGAFIYTPNAGYVGSDSFNFTAIDTVSGTASAAATVSLTVQGLPLTGVAPLANGGSLAVYAGQPANGILAAVDAAVNPLTFTAVQPTHGKLTLTAATGGYTYTPAAGYTGSDSFSFTATDTVTHLASNTATINISVAAVPLQAVAPLANDLNLTLYAGQTYVGMLSAIDVNGNPMSYAITTQAKHGVATVDVKTGAFTYTPAAGYSGPDSFAYTATDTVSKLKSSAATTSLDITPAPPSAVHHGGPGRGAYGQLSLLLLGLLALWRRSIAWRGLLPALVACGLLWAVAVAADTDEPPPPPAPMPADSWYLAAQASIIKPDSSRDAATHGPRGWGVLAGKEYGDFSFQLDAAYHADNPRSLGGIASWKSYGVDGLWYFEHRKSPVFSPFVDTGLGFAEEYAGDNSTQRKTYLALGAGFDSAPWQSLPVFLRTDLQLQHVFSRYNDLVLSFGLGFRFGGSTPPAAPLALPDASPLDKYPMAWCAQEGGEAEETDSGWVCVLPGGKTESRPSAAPPAAAIDSPSAVTYAQPPTARLDRR